MGLGKPVRQELVQMSNTLCRELAKLEWSKWALREWMADPPSFALELSVNLLDASSNSLSTRNSETKDLCILTTAELKSKMGIPYSPQYIARLEKAGKFPRHFKISGGSRGPNVWWKHQVEEWLLTRAGPKWSRNRC